RHTRCLSDWSSDVCSSDLDITNGYFFVAYALAGVATLGLVVLVAKRAVSARLRDAAFYGLAGSVSNVGYLGIPLLVALMGERAEIGRASCREGGVWWGGGG